MRRALLLVFALTATSVATAPPAYAQNDAALVEAQARFKEGLDFADNGNHDAARLKFQQAWAVFKSPAVLYNLARSEQLTGHHLEAFEHFKEFLKTGADPKVTDAQRARARDNVGELSKKLGQIDLEVPPSARVSVDGRPAPEAAREPIAVDPGRHILEATFEGRIKSVSVDCEAGATKKAKIEFDGGAVSSGASSSAAPPADADRPASERVIIPAALGVAGLAALGVGLGFAVASHSAKDEEDSLRKPGVCADTQSAGCNALNDARSKVDSRATVATIGYVGGGVLLAAAAITYFVWPSARRTGSRLVVSPTADGGMVQLGGRF